MGALNRWLEQRDDLMACRVPRSKVDNAECLELHHLADAFVDAKDYLVATGKITHRTYTDYYTTRTTVTQALGRTRRLNDIRPGDFDHLRHCLAKTMGPVSLGNTRSGGSESCSSSATTAS